MNNYVEIEDYCLSHKGVISSYKKEWDAILFLLSGKMFALIGCDNNGKSIISLKLNPDKSQFLRSQYIDIVPGYYLNKIHWNSVYLEGLVPEDILKDMIDESYMLVLSSFSKKKQAEILHG